MQCEKCGCTNEDPCRLNGMPCMWFSRRICSCCAPLAEVLTSYTTSEWWDAVVAASENGELHLEPCAAFVNIDVQPQGRGQA